jgi:SAM-dependent methyltransferase
MNVKNFTKARVLWKSLRGQITRKVYFDYEKRKAWLECKDLSFDLETFYEDSYRAGYYNDNKYQLEVNHSKMMVQQERRIRWISDFVGMNSTLLEIGCSTGYFLECIGSYVKQTHGLEMNKIEAAYASSRGLSVTQGSTKSLGKAFQHVCLFQVLEHQSDPILFLREIKENLLEESGYIHIEVPTLDNPLVSLYMIPEFRDFWFQEPHLHYYSSLSLIELVESLGFTVLSVETSQTTGPLNHLNWFFTGKPMKQRSAATASQPDFSFADDIRETSPALYSKLNDLFADFHSQYTNLLQSYNYGDILALTAKVN